MSFGILIRRVLVALGVIVCAAANAVAIDNLRVAYPSLNTSVFALIIAQKEGYFKEEGLNVELLSIRGEIAIRTTLSGDVDFFTNAGSALAAAVRAVPVRLVTVFQDKPGWDLISTPDIKSIAQLRGKNHRDHVAGRITRRGRARDLAQKRSRSGQGCQSSYDGR